MAPLFDPLEQFTHETSAWQNLHTIRILLILDWTVEEVKREDRVKLNKGESWKAEGEKR